MWSRFEIKVAFPCEIAEVECIMTSKVIFPNKIAGAKCIITSDEIKIDFIFIKLAIHEKKKKSNPEVKKIWHQFLDKLSINFTSLLHSC